MKRQKTNALRFLACCLLFFVGMILEIGETRAAASSHDNARVFYEDTGKYTEYHAEVYEGSVYYATQAKLASSSSNLKYGTVGYDISLTGNGKTVSFSVKRVADGSSEEGSMKEKAGSRVYYNDYEYNLYSITDEQLFELARESNPTVAEVVLSSSIIYVYIDAIMTTNRNGALAGNVTEYSPGKLTEWGTLYHLKDEADLNAMKRIFSGHEFESFRNIEERLYNNTLSIRYFLDGGTVRSSYSSQSDGNKDDVLHLNGSPYVTSSTLLNSFYLVNTDTLQLKKTGYHLDPGKEWTYDNRIFDDEAEQRPKKVCPGVGQQDVKIYMIANWKANKYKIKYDTNGGSGTFPIQELEYDQTGTLHTAIPVKSGNTFKGWKVKNTSTTYQAGAAVKNLTDVDGATVTMVAQWETDIIPITTDKQGGFGGTDVFYEKYDVAWYSDKNGKNSITKLPELPYLEGYDFVGYYTGKNGYGKQIVDSKAEGGKLVADTDTFTTASTVYAHWTPAKYEITFDKQGGSGGTDKADVYYKKALPQALAPTRPGYSFQGYFTEPNGAGTKYYNEPMIGQFIYPETTDITLYAYWVDDVAPDVRLIADPSGWTNGLNNLNLYGIRGAYVYGSATDSGSGLESVTLYFGNEVDVSKIAKKATNLNDILKYINTKEGANMYTIEAIDKAGNMAQARTVAYYDVKAPVGMVENGIHVGTNLEVEVFVTDYNIE